MSPCEPWAVRYCDQIHDGILACRKPYLRCEYEIRLNSLDMPQFFQAIFDTEIERLEDTSCFCKWLNSKPCATCLVLPRHILDKSSHSQLVLQTASKVDTEPTLEYILGNQHKLST